MEESLDLKKLAHWLDATRELAVHVHIPRFKVEDSFSLKEKLQSMGLVDLFAPEKASLPGAVYSHTSHHQSRLKPGFSFNFGSSTGLNWNLVHTS